MTIENDEKFDMQQELTPDQATAGFVHSMEMLIRVAPMLGVSKEDLVSTLGVHLHEVLTADHEDYHGLVVEIRRHGEKLDIKLVSEGEVA